MYRRNTASHVCQVDIWPVSVHDDDPPALVVILVPVEDASPLDQDGPRRLGQFHEAVLDERVIQQVVIVAAVCSQEKKPI